jgi:ABC-2 type transport system ATP-binding protein
VLLDLGRPGVLRRTVAGTAMSAAIVAEGLHVAFGETNALIDVDLSVDAGSTVGVLGHNGAGKTTLIRVVSTLVRPSAGRVAVEGFDVVEQSDAVRRRIGVTGQYAGLDDFLTGRENLELVGRLAGLNGTVRTRAAELIEWLGLQDLAERRVGQMSGGSRRRVDLAASLVAWPSVLVLDEPSTGLDPIARAALWAVVEELTAGGTTVLLTTQYLEEADRLADHIVMLAHGRVVASGTPRDLKRLIGDKVVAATIPVSHVPMLHLRPDAIHALDDDRVRVSFITNERRTPAHVVTDLAASAGDLHDLDVSSPSLDDVFAHLNTTGAPT